MRHATYHPHLRMMLVSGRASCSCRTGCASVLASCRRAHGAAGQGSAGSKRRIKNGVVTFTMLGNMPPTCSRVFGDHLGFSGGFFFLLVFVSGWLRDELSHSCVWPDIRRARRWDADAGRAAGQIVPGWGPSMPAQQIVGTVLVRWISGRSISDMASVRGI